MKRRSQPRQRKKRNTYAKKRASGQMMYDPAPRVAYRDGRCFLIR